MHNNRSSFPKRCSILEIFTVVLVVPVMAMEDMEQEQEQETSIWGMFLEPTAPAEC